MRKINILILKLFCIFALGFGFVKASHFLYEEGYPYLSIPCVLTGIVVVPNLVYHIFEKLNK